MKKITALLLFILLLSQILTVQAAEENGKISIEFDKTSAKVGDYIEAAIKIENIMAEYIVVPVHFNSKVVKVADKDGNLVLSGIKTASEARDGSIGLTPLQALSNETDENNDPKYWNGAIFENDYYSEINNENGFYRLMFSNTKTKEIVSETLISIKFVAIGTGDTDIRFASKEDAIYDSSAENGPIYVHENIENPMDASLNIDFANIVIPKLTVSASESTVTPPNTQSPQTGGGGGTTGIFTPPPSVNDTLEVVFTEKEIENMLPRAADETKNSLNIKIEAADTVNKIVIKLPVSTIKTALSAWVFTTEFDTPLGKISFDNKEISESFTEASQYIICTITKNEKEITIDEASLKSEDIIEKAFDDLQESHWAYEYIMTLVSGGYLNGVSETEFKPDENVTREQFAKMLVSVLHIYDDKASCHFSDIDESHWAYKDVASAVKSGIITGNGDGSFGISRNITRQEMAVMVARASLVFPEKIHAITFSDQDEIAEWAVEAITKMQRADIINGMPDGSFAPNANATRAQAAKIIFSVLAML